MSEYKFDNGFIYRNGFKISAPNAARIMSDAHEQSKKDQSEIESLRTQLAKANESVKGLELTVKGFKEFIALARVMITGFLLFMLGFGIGVVFCLFLSVMGYFD